MASDVRLRHREHGLGQLEAPGTPQWKRDEVADDDAVPQYVPKKGDLFGPDNQEYMDTPLRSPVEIPEPGALPGPLHIWDPIFVALCRR